MPITFVIDEIIHEAIMNGEYEKAKAIALGELVKIIRDLWGEVEAIKDMMEEAEKHRKRQIKTRRN